MPYKPYTSTQKAEALAVLTEHGNDLKAAHADLLERWGFAPSLSTLSTWLLSGPNGHDKGITPPTPDPCQDQALKGFEGRKTSPLLEGLLEALGNLSDEYVVIVVGKGGRGQ